MNKRDTLFWAKVPPLEGDKCREWQGSRLRKNGKLTYGEFCSDGGKVLAHRYAFSVTQGEIPKGMLVCHQCNNPGCVNPNHLYLSDNAGNIKDAWRDGLIISGNTKKTQCPKCGGQYALCVPSKRRFCPHCKSEWARAKRARLSAMKAERETSEGTI